jgi:hypothetical protein
MVDSFIKQRALRQKTLDTCVPKLWHEIGTMLDNCCTDFNEEYSDIGKMALSPENGHRVIVTLTFADPRRKIAYIQFQLDESAPRISVTANNATKQFAIDAQGSDCFIKSQTGERLAVFDFAKVALEDVLFKPPAAPRVQVRGSSAPRGPYN